MSDMPQRPRQHELEDESRDALRAAIPSGWVFRDLSHDYGIDGEVEVFEEARATGLVFKVQLKATDTDSMEVRLRISQANYLRALEEPVLVVLYRAKDLALYARWFQSFDPYRDKQSKSGLTFLFDEGHSWSDETAAKLRRDLEIRRIIRPGGALPFKLWISTPVTGLVCGVDIAQIRIAILEAFSEFGDIVRLVDERDALGSLRITPEVCSVDVRSLASSTVHYPEPWPSDPAPGQAVADAMTCVGIVLERFGIQEAAGRLFARFARDSSIVNSSEMVTSIASCLERTGRFIEALALVEEAQEANPSEAEQLRMFASLLFSSTRPWLDETQGQAVVDYLENRHSSAETDSRRGEASYNLANWLQSIGRRQEALGWYERAAAEEPDYLARDYFHAELGGSLFETRRHAEAAASYERALELREDDQLRALLADALLMAGRYAEARVHFDQVLTSPDIASPEWNLKLRALDSIQAVADEAQARDEDAAHETLRRLDESSGLDQIRAMCHMALESDALCVDAWARIGFAEMERGSTDSLEPLLVAAVVARSSPELWPRPSCLRSPWIRGILLLS